MINRQQKFTQNLLNRHRTFFYHYRCLHETYTLVLHFNSIPVLGLYIYIYIEDRFVFFLFAFIRISRTISERKNRKRRIRLDLYLCLYIYTQNTRARYIKLVNGERGGGKPHFSAPNAFHRDDYVVILMRTVTRLSHRYFRFVGHQTCSTNRLESPFCRRPAASAAVKRLAPQVVNTHRAAHVFRFRLPETSDGRRNKKKFLYVARSNDRR